MIPEASDWIFRFPIDKLYADKAAGCYKALGFAPGWGREGGPGAWAAKLPFVNGYVKLLVMCAGIGSPGTLREVIRGYTGDRDAPQVFNDGSNVDISWKSAFNLAGGKGFQRPFELATFRLTNMIAILRDWEVTAGSLPLPPPLSLVIFCLPDPSFPATFLKEPRKGDFLPRVFPVRCNPFAPACPLALGLCLLSTS